jgi:hypothetical protein
MQADQVAGAQEFPQPRPYSLGLGRAARGEIDRIGIEDGHVLII